MKVLLAPSRSDWADEEDEEAEPEPISYSDAVAPIRDPVVPVKPIAVAKPEVAAEPTPPEGAASAAKSKPKEAAKIEEVVPKIEELLKAPEEPRQSAEQVRADALSIIAEAQKQALECMGPAKARDASQKPKSNRKPRRVPFLIESISERHITESVPAVKPNPWKTWPKEQPAAAAQNEVAEATMEAPKPLKAPMIPATPIPNNGNRKAKKQRRSKADKNSTKPQTAPLEKPSLTDAPVKPSIWFTDAPVTKIFKSMAEVPQVVVPVEPAAQSVVFNMQVAVELSSLQAETVRPPSPVHTTEEGVVVKLPSPTPTAIPTTPEKQTTVMSPPTVTTPASPRNAVSPISPVVPRSFERGRVRTPSLSEALLKSLETSKETEDGLTIIVANSTSSPCRSRASSISSSISSSIMSEETVIITDSSQSRNPRPNFMRINSENQEHGQWFHPFNGPYNSPTCMSSPSSKGSNLSPTAEPFVPRGQMEQHVPTLETSAGYSLEYHYPSTSQLELSPQGRDIALPSHPVLGLSIPPTQVSRSNTHHNIPPMEAAVTQDPALTPTPEYLEVLRRERNRLDLILRQDNLIREIEARAARLALRGLYPDGTVRGLSQVQKWEMQQQMLLHPRFRILDKYQ